MEKVTAPQNGVVHELTRAEAREAFDAAARRYLHMSGDEFLRAWDSGSLCDPDDQPGVMQVAVLLPLVR